MTQAVEVVPSLGLAPTISMCPHSLHQDLLQLSIAHSQVGSKSQALLHANSVEMNVHTMSQAQLQALLHAASVQTAVHTTCAITARIKTCCNSVLLSIRSFPHYKPSHKLCCMQHLFKRLSIQYMPLQPASRLAAAQHCSVLGRLFTRSQL